MKQPQAAQKENVIWKLQAETETISEIVLKLKFKLYRHHFFFVGVKVCEWNPQ